MMVDLYRKYKKTKNDGQVKCDMLVFALVAIGSIITIFIYLRLLSS
jgi:hypothetical protein